MYDLYDRSFYKEFELRPELIKRIEKNSQKMNLMIEKHSKKMVAAG